ncbi:TioA protein [Salmonella enterica]|uniref:TioA protein n=2 Tax=Salmonella enterica TaxID=28901 RepID=A0A756DMB1_SALER|nr:TioA protein [Salmonella enterica subsp. enterica serovar Javiana]EAM5567727.1 TioA protein [Salmonella enterica]ECE5830312.1 TioA protein [Salmonella enterica subsp. enterica]ECU5731684.1 TioA protein [Salmonella enterica subsp. enterica serovar 9,12:-:1,5]EHF3058336.1 TioA protein [Salmonella enterica subsp. enterica serovar 9,12-:1,5]
MVRYHPVHTTKHDGNIDIYFVEPLWKKEWKHENSSFYFDELQKTFCFFNNRHGQSRYIIKLPWEFAFINADIINQLHSIGLFAISIDFNNNPIYLNEYIRNYENYCIDVWFDFCVKHYYVNNFEGLAFFKAGIASQNSNIINSIYDRHMISKVLVEGINCVEQRARYQHKVDYMCGMQWPSLYDGCAF